MLKETYKGIEISYTICFCRYLPDEKVLLVKRAKRPNKDKWNGLGGKVENFDVDPRKSVEREVSEEADIDLNSATNVRFSGYVTWDTTKESEQYTGGMYVFIADFDENVLFAERQTREGILDWKDQSWVLDQTNKEVVGNIPLFLTEMLQSEVPIHCHCTYMNGGQTNFDVLPYESDLRKSI
jgi:8-oxo-dGTP diphosphatase